MFGKLENGALILAPKTIIENARVHYHPTEEMYLSYGYLPIIDTPYPEVSKEEPKYYDFVWEEKDESIIKVWREAEPPTPKEPEPTIEDRLVSVEAEVRDTKEALDMILSGVTE